MKNKLISLSVAIGAALSFQVNAAETMIKSCTLPYNGSVNTIIQSTDTFAVARIVPKKTDGVIVPYSYYNNDGELKESKRANTVLFAANVFDGNCGFNSDDVRKAVETDEPNGIAQSRKHSRTLAGSYDADETVGVLLYKAKGTLYAAELDQDSSTATPLKHSVNKGNGAIPLAKVGNRTFGGDDNAPVTYRLSQISDDAKLVIGTATLNQDVLFDNGKKSLPKDYSLAVYWTIKESCDVNKGACNNKTASKLTLPVSGKVISSDDVGRSSNIKADNFKNFDMPKLNADTTLSEVTSVVTQADGSYLISGKSVSGKGMLVQLTL